MRSLNDKQNRKLKFFKSGEPRKAVKEMMEFSLKLLEFNGIYRRKGETPEEFGFRADKSLKSGNVFRFLKGRSLMRLRNLPRKSSFWFSEAFQGC